MKIVAAVVVAHLLATPAFADRTKEASYQDTPGGVLHPDQRFGDDHFPMMQLANRERAAGRPDIENLYDFLSTLPKLREAPAIAARAAEGIVINTKQKRAVLALQAQATAVARAAGTNPSAFAALDKLQENAEAIFAQGAQIEARRSDPSPLAKLASASFSSNTGQRVLALTHQWQEVWYQLSVIGERAGYAETSEEYRASNILEFLSLDEIARHELARAKFASAKQADQQREDEHDARLRREFREQQEARRNYKPSAVEVQNRNTFCDINPFKCQK